MVLKTIIAQFIQGDYKTWDENISESYVLNTAVRKTIRYTSAMLCFQRKLALPNAPWDPRFVSFHKQKEELGKRCIARGAKGSSESSKSVEVTSDSLSKGNWYYSLWHLEVQFGSGDMVIRQSYVLFSAAGAFASKLARKFIRP